MNSFIRKQSGLRSGLLTLIAAVALLLIPGAVQAQDGGASTATVNVAHFAPFGADVDGTSVTIKVTGEGVDEMLEAVKFGDVAEDVELPSGVELTIQVIPTGETEPAIEATVNLDSGAAYTVAAIGGANNWDLQLLPLVDETTAPESGALVRIGHLAPFADANTEGSTAVDICNDGAVILPGVEFPEVTEDYVPLPAGDYDNLQIALTGTDCGTVALDLPSLTLKNRVIVSVFAIGLAPSDANFPLNVYIDETPPPPATVNVAHFAPFGTDVDSTSVTIKVTGEGVDEMLEAVKFGDVAEDVELPSGVELTIQVIPTGETEPAIETTVTLDAGTAYTVAAIGGANNWDLQLLPLVDETTAPESGALVRIGHLAPFADANTEGSTAVDICNDGAVILPGVEFPEVTEDYVPLPAGNYDNLQIALAGTDCDTVALDLPPVALGDGAIGSVFAIGLLPSDANFPLNVWTDLPATVNVAHFAPFGADVDGTSVTVRVNSADEISDFKFGDVIEDVVLPSGEELLIEILPTGTETAAISATVELDPAGAYTVAAIGGANNWDLQLLPLVDEITAPESGALVRIGHLAPFADANTEGSTAVDVCNDGSAVLEGVEFSEVEDYLSLPAGEYDSLQIAVAGTDCGTVALDLPTVVLENGAIGSVFAIGLLPTDPNFPLTVWTDLPVSPDMFYVYLPIVFGETE